MSEQVETILSILNPMLTSLSVSEKLELLAMLTDLLKENNGNSSPSDQSQSNAVNSVTFNDGNNVLNFSPIQNSGNVRTSPDFM